MPRRADAARAPLRARGQVRRIAAAPRARPESLAHRLGGVLARKLATPLEQGTQRILDLRAARRLRVRQEGRAFDRRFGVDTVRDRAPGRRRRSEIRSPNWEFGWDYEPAPIAPLSAQLAALDIDYSQFTFVDFGSGKGRSLLLAAEFPFQLIIGVEYCLGLHVVAERNIVTYRNPKQRCENIVCVLGDCATYAIPHTPLVAFFNHPFDAPVFGEVIANLRASLAARPRPLLILYHDPRCAELFTPDAFARRPAATGGGRAEPFAAFEARR